MTYHILPNDCNSGERTIKLCIHFARLAVDYAGATGRLRSSECRLPVVNCSSTSNPRWRPFSVSTWYQARPISSWITRLLTAFSLLSPATMRMKTLHCITFASTDSWIDSAILKVPIFALRFFCLKQQKRRALGSATTRLEFIGSFKSSELRGNSMEVSEQQSRSGLLFFDIVLTTIGAKFDSEEKSLQALRTRDCLHMTSRMKSTYSAADSRLSFLLNCSLISWWGARAGLHLYAISSCLRIGPLTANALQARTKPHCSHGHLLFLNRAGYRYLSSHLLGIFDTLTRL